MCMPIDKAIARPNLDEVYIRNGCTHCNEASVFFLKKTRLFEVLPRISAKSSLPEICGIVSVQCPTRQWIVFLAKRPKYGIKRMKTLKHIEDLKILTFSRGRHPTPLPQREGEHRSSRNPPPPPLSCGGYN